MFSNNIWNVFVSKNLLSRISNPIDQIIVLTEQQIWHWTNIPDQISFETFSIIRDYNASRWLHLIRRNVWITSFVSFEMQEQFGASESRPSKAIITEATFDGTVCHWTSRGRDISLECYFWNIILPFFTSIEVKANESIIMENSARRAITCYTVGLIAV